jgi:hypothetical protein
MLGTSIQIPVIFILAVPTVLCSTYRLLLRLGFAGFFRSTAISNNTILASAQSNTTRGNPWWTCALCAEPQAIYACLGLIGDLLYEILDLFCERFFPHRMPASAAFSDLAESPRARCTEASLFFIASNNTAQRNGQIARTQQAKAEAKLRYLYSRRS